MTCLCGCRSLKGVSVLRRFIPVPDKSLGLSQYLIPSRALGSGEVLFKPLTSLAGLVFVSGFQSFTFTGLTFDLYFIVQ